MEIDDNMEKLSMIVVDKLLILQNNLSKKEFVVSWILTAQKMNRYYYADKNIAEHIWDKFVSSNRNVLSFYSILDSEGKKIFIEMLEDIII